MKMLDILEKKKCKEELTKEEIEFFIKGYSNGEIPDYQAAALIMAIFLNGMTKSEMKNLTISMAYSSKVLDLSELNEIVVDKHSTGGVGDKVSLIVLPIISSLGIVVAKMSGRGLGITGGTVDKLESIPGYNTNIKMEQFIKEVKKIGISIIGQTEDLAKADKMIYALRDSISCVDSIPLIASSIMSKKIASGADKILIDVTVGKGAFMQDLESARELANLMIEIGNMVNKEVICVLTKMDEPLGFSVGNTLEVIESIEFLKGKMPEDLKEVILEVGSYMIKLAGAGEDLEHNKNKMIENIENGKAYEKFIELIENQNGDISYINDINKFKKAKYIEPIYSLENGYVEEINAKEIAKIVNFLGAGREKKEDNIDFDVGIILNKKAGDKVELKEILAYIHANDENKIKKAKKLLEDSIKISEKLVKKEKMILEIIV